MHTVQEDYKPYGKARPVLLANLGNYCSYCEDVFHSGTNLQTEHIQPKGLDVSGVKPYQELSTKWDNFLLGCATCNGKGNKGDKDVHLNDIHLPHRNNTYLSLLYKEAGVVIPNPVLKGNSLLHAQALIELVHDVGEAGEFFGGRRIRAVLDAGEAGRRRREGDAGLAGLDQFVVF